MHVVAVRFAGLFPPGNCLFQHSSGAIVPASPGIMLAQKEIVRWGLRLVLEGKLEQPFVPRRFRLSSFDAAKIASVVQRDAVLAAHPKRPFSRSCQLFVDP